MCRDSTAQQSHRRTRLRTLRDSSGRSERWASISVRERKRDRRGRGLRLWWKSIGIEARHRLWWKSITIVDVSRSRGVDPRYWLRPAARQAYNRRRFINVVLRLWTWIQSLLGSSLCRHLWKKYCYYILFLFSNLIC